MRNTHTHTCTLKHTEIQWVIRRRRRRQNNANAAARKLLLLLLMLLNEQLLLAKVGKTTRKGERIRVRTQKFTAKKF